MTKLCPRGKSAAKRKFKVYPSAYANAYASKICAGKIKDPSGVKRKDFKGPKPSRKKGGMMIIIGVNKEPKKKLKPKKAVVGALLGLGAAAMGKKFLKKKSKEARPQQKGTGPIKILPVNPKEEKLKQVMPFKAKGGYIGSHIKSDLAGTPVSNKSYESYYKDLL